MSNLPWLCLRNISLAYRLLLDTQTLPTAEREGVREYEQCNQGLFDQPAAVAVPPTSA